MNIADLYERCQVMPQLATHMLRVAGVGKIVAENWKDGCDADFATKLCLVHDLGNIVKFDLSGKPENAKFGQIEDLEKWKRIQKEFWTKYGHNAHEATIEMLKDAELDQFVAPIIEEEMLYFMEPKEKELAQASLPAIILLYADCRVTPRGVTSYRQRIDDLKNRYGGVASPTWYKWTYWFDDWMQAQVDFDLSQITEKTVTPLREELLSYNI